LTKVETNLMKLMNRYPAEANIKADPPKLCDAFCSMGFVEGLDGGQIKCSSGQFKLAPCERKALQTIVLDDDYPDLVAGDSTMSTRGAEIHLCREHYRIVRRQTGWIPWILRNKLKVLGGAVTLGALGTAAAMPTAALGVASSAMSYLPAMPSVSGAITKLGTGVTALNLYRAIRGGPTVPSAPRPVQRAAAASGVPYQTSGARMQTDADVRASIQAGAGAKNVFGR